MLSKTFSEFGLTRFCNATALNLGLMAIAADDATDDLACPMFQSRNKELSTEVTLLNHIVIRASEASLWPTCDSHQCKILEELTSHLPRSNVKQLQTE